MGDAFRKTEVWEVCTNWYDFSTKYREEEGAYAYAEDKNVFKLECLEHVYS